MTYNEEKYFIGSNGDSPERLYFCYDDAIAGDDDYIDSFDASGAHIEAYKRTSELTYTKDF